MTYRQALADFKRYTLPRLPKDRAARSEAWCVEIDRLQKDGTITERQAEKWSNPWGGSKNPGPK